MKIRLGGVWVMGLLLSLMANTSGCHRKVYAELEQIDPIDRRSNLPMVGPINRELADIKKGGALTVIAPYNATTYFIYAVSRSVMNTSCFSPSLKIKD